MGKKVQGAKLRAKKRAREAVEELQEQQAEQAIAKSAAEKAIFVFDTTGEAVPHHLKPPNAEKVLANKKRKSGLSDKEEQQVQRLLEKHNNDAKKLQEIANSGRRILNHSKEQARLIRANDNSVGGDRRLNKSTKNNFDLWDDNDHNSSNVKSLAQTVVAKTTDSSIDEAKTKESITPSPGIGSSLAGTRPQHTVVKGKTLAMVSNEKKNNNQTASQHVAVDVAQSAGQSYHPDPVAHTELLQQAAAAEMIREQAVQHLKTPLGTGMSEETRALLVGSSDEDSDSDDDDDEQNDNNDVNMSVGVIPKRSSKLTKAQRNKQKRIKQELIEVAKRRAEKKLLKQAGNIHRITKEMKQQDKERQEQKSKLEKKKQQSAIQAGKNVDLKAFQKDPILAPTVPVALLSTKSGTNNQGSSLRTLQPKGSLVTDRMASYTDRNILDFSSLKKKTSTKMSVIDANKFNAVTVIDNNATKQKRKRTKKALKGKHNQGWKGPDFQIKG